MSGQESRLLGAWGEELAARWVREQGGRVIAANFRCRFGEIDLIVKNKKYLAFVEVKLRKSDRFAAAMEYVDRRKQDRLRMTASIYLSQNETKLQPRFDVIEIYAPQGMKTPDPEIIHLEDAFQ